MSWESVKRETKRLNDWDLVSAFEFNYSKDMPFSVTEIKKVIAKHEGKNDVEDWAWLVQLNDNKYSFISGECDFTGWDCRSSIDIHGMYSSVKECLKHVGKYEREFKDQIIKGRKITFRDKGIFNEEE